ncbi:MAG: hypothetical protein C5B59_17585 [Bacteroidetes bacterium]|nr:MAG: hypothetical protein C5B59_17585 [Bacteroidota bacterium]
MLILTLIILVWFSSSYIINLPLSTELFNEHLGRMQFLPLPTAWPVQLLLGVIWFTLFPFGKKLIWESGRFRVTGLLVFPRIRLHLPQKYENT